MSRACLRRDIRLRYASTFTLSSTFVATTFVFALRLRAFARDVAYALSYAQRIASYSRIFAAIHDVLRTCDVASATRNFARICLSFNANVFVSRCVCAMIDFKTIGKTIDCALVLRDMSCFTFISSLRHCIDNHQYKRTRTNVECK